MLRRSGIFSSAKVQAASLYAAPTEFDAGFGTDSYKDCALTELIRLRSYGADKTADAELIPLMRRSSSSPKAQLQRFSATCTVSRIWPAKSVSPWDVLAVWSSQPVPRLILGLKKSLPCIRHYRLGIKRW